MPPSSRPLYIPAHTKPAKLHHFWGKVGGIAKKAARVQEFKARTLKRGSNTTKVCTYACFLKKQTHPSTFPALLQAFSLNWRNRGQVHNCV